jgi:hypothetical protein
MPTPTRTRNFGREEVQTGQPWAQGRNFVPGAKRIKTVIDGEGRRLHVFEHKDEGIITWYVWEPKTKLLHAVATADDFGDRFENITVNSSREGAYGTLIGAIFSEGRKLKVRSNDISDGNQDVSRKPGNPRKRHRKNEDKS